MPSARSAAASASTSTAGFSGEVATMNSSSRETRISPYARRPRPKVNRGAGGRSGTDLAAPARHERDHGHQLVGQRIDEFLRVSRFLQRPFDAVSEMRLLVQIQLLRTGERLDAGEYRVVRPLQPLRRLLRRDAHAGRREALHQIGHDRIGELVHLLAIEPVSEHAGAALEKQIIAYISWKTRSQEIQFPPLHHRRHMVRYAPSISRANRGSSMIGDARILSRSDPRSSASLARSCASSRFSRT